jgi:hypothetical protein
MATGTALPRFERKMPIAHCMFREAHGRPVANDFGIRLRRRQAPLLARFDEMFFAVRRTLHFFGMNYALASV